MSHATELKLFHPGDNAAVSTAVQIHDFHVWFGDAHILQGIDTAFREYCVNCIVGPSGSGKSTLIRSINRMNDEAKNYRFKGAISLNGQNILTKSLNVTRLRTEVGMVFQRPCVFPKSIFDNVLFGIQHLRKLSRQEKQQIVEETLKSVSLWKEVSHRLHDKSASLSLGQQQRLCIARTLAVKPKMLLLDEPTSSLDPVSTRAIEALMLELKKTYTIVLVTHDIRQAQRVADYLIFMCNGRIIEQGPKRRLFTQPQKEQTRQYLNEEYCDCD